jgi:hypothetical protein
VLAAAAAGILALFVALHAAGLRELVPAISGTVPAGGPGLAASLALALAYALSYVAAVLACPILTGASILLLAARLLVEVASARRSPAPADTHGTSPD